VQSRWIQFYALIDAADAAIGKELYGQYPRRFNSWKEYGSGFHPSSVGGDEDRLRIVSPAHIYIKGLDEALKLAFLPCVHDIRLF